jgi:hypothetical protein
MKKTLKNSYQQGDLLLRRLKAMPEGEVKVVSKSRLVLAPGESGHSHVVEDDDAELIQIGERILLRLKRAATVTHEEHNAPTSLLPEPERLAPGIWEVGRVREHDYFQQMVRQVID